MAATISDITLVIKVITDSSPVDRLNGSMTRMERLTNNATLANARLGKSVGPLQGHFAGLSDKLGLAERKMDAVFRAGVHMQAMGRDLMGVGKQIAGFAQNIITTYAEYDFVLRQTSLALNTNVYWQGQLDKAIQATAIQLGKFSPKEVAVAYRIWGAATGDVVDSQESLARITRTVTDIMMATAMVGGNLEANLQGVYGITKQYNLGIEKASYVTQILSLLTERTALNFGDLTQAFIYAGSYTGAIGAKFEDIAQALGVMADAGFRGTKAGRGLSMFFEAITAPSGPAKKALDAMAVSMGKISWKNWVFPKGKFQGMRDLITKVASGLEHMTKVERAEFLARAASNNAVRAMLPLVTAQIALWDKQRAAGQKLTSILDEQKYSLKSASTFFASMSTSFLASFDAVLGAFGNSFFPLIQLVAMQIMKFAGPVLDTVKGALKDLAKFLEANPAFTEVAVKIGAIAAIVLTLAGAFLVALGTMAFFYSNIILLGAGLVPLVTMFATLALAFAGFAVKVAMNTGGIQDALAHLAESIGRVFNVLTGGASGSQVLKDIAAAVNSIVDAGIAVVARSIEMIASALDKLTPEQIGILRDIGAALLAIVVLNRGIGLVATVVGGLAMSLLSLASAAGGIKAVAGLFAPLLGNILPLLSAVRLLAVAFGLLALIGAPIVAAFAIVGAVVAGVVLAWQTNFMGFRDFVNGLIVWFTTELPAAIGRAIGTIGQIVGQLLSPITDNLPKIIAFIQGIADSIGQVWVPILEHLAEVAGEVFGQVVEAFNQVVAEVMTHVQPLVDELAKLGAVIFDFLGPAWDFIVTVVGGAVGLIIKSVTKLVNFVAPFIQGLADGLMRIFGVLAEFLVRTVGNFVSTIIDVIKGFVEIIRGIFEVFTAALKGDWSGVWKGIQTIVKGVVDAVIGIVRGLGTLLVDIIRGALQLVTSAFEFVFGTKPGSILAGIGDFIRSFLANVGKFVGDVVKFIGGIPGKMLDIGKNVVKGLWDGIVGAKDWIINKITGFINSIIPGPIKDALGIKSPSRVMMGLGVNIVEGLAIGIEKTTSAYDAMVKQANDIARVAGGTFNDAMDLSTVPITASITGNNTKTINLNVDVTSSDRSVNDVDLNALADLITGSEMVRALERMSSVD